MRRGEGRNRSSGVIVRLRKKNNQNLKKKKEEEEDVAMEARAGVQEDSPTLLRCK